MTRDIPKGIEKGRLSRYFAMITSSFLKGCWNEVELLIGSALVDASISSSKNNNGVRNGTK